MKHKLVLGCVVVALGLGMFAISQTPVRVATDGTADVSRSAEQLWANALLLSLPFSENSSDEADVYFAKAFQQATRKAPIYTAMGDAESGPKVLREAFDSLVKEVERDRDTTKRELNGNIESLVRFMERDEDQSTAFYIAAVSADTNYKPAWFRLAKFGNRDLAGRAIDELIRLDPDNALLFYMKAAHDIEAGDMNAVLASVSLGNTKSACRSYQTEVPNTFHLRYPNTKAFRELGIVGKPIPSTSLAYMVRKSEESWSWSDPLRNELLQLQRSLVGEVSKTEPRSVEQTALVEDRLIASRDMGSRLMAEETRDLQLMITGMWLIGDPARELAALYLSRGDADKLEKNQSIRDATRRFHTAFTAALGRIKTTDEELRLIFLGEKDALKNERRIFDEVAGELRRFP